jgi:hypothetical protein
VYVGCVDESLIGFVDQGRGLQGVIRPFAIQTTVSQASQFLVDHRNELLNSALVSSAPCEQQSGYFLWRRRSHFPFWAEAL